MIRPIDQQRILDFLATLECLDQTAHPKAFADEITRTGGSYLPLGLRHTSHFCELSLHGIVAYGASEEEMLRNWKKAATAQAAAFVLFAPLPFAHPRNHAEEIANARALAPLWGLK